MSDIRRIGDRQHPWFKELYELEQELLSPAVRSDRRRLDDLMRDDFIEVGSSGRIYEKWLLIDMMVNEAHGTVVLRDFAVRDILANVGLTTYRSVGNAGQTRRSSLWVKEFGRWRMVFHQGTRLPDKFRSSARQPPKFS